MLTAEWWVEMTRQTYLVDLTAKDSQKPWGVARPLGRTSWSFSHHQTSEEVVNQRIR